VSSAYFVSDWSLPDADKEEIYIGMERKKKSCEEARVLWHTVISAL